MTDTKCNQPAASFIPRWGMSFACVLPKGHPGDHRQGGTCFAHGEYVGPQCPKWPNCVTDPQNLEKLSALSMIDEIERQHCHCGAELDRNKPKTWEHCGIHDRCEQLRSKVAYASHVTAALRQELADVTHQLEVAAVGNGIRQMQVASLTKERDELKRRVEALESHITDGLFREVKAEIVAQKQEVKEEYSEKAESRVEELEKALREIVDWPNLSTMMVCREIARKALKNE